MDPAVTYGSYLRVDELLALQQPRSDGPEHDELLFIVIHQVYELWFKELLHELDRVVALLDADDSHRAQHTLKRILTILKVLVAQLDILETMTPLEFLSFRERLEAASGFQSDQFRQIEFVLGASRSAAIERFPKAAARAPRSSARYREPTLWDAFLHYLAREGYAVPAAQLARDVDAPRRAVAGDAADPDRRLPARPEERRALRAAGRSRRRRQEWRYRHVKMVERTIGAKPGTGGSPRRRLSAHHARAAIFPGPVGDSQRPVIGVTRA